MLYDISNMLHRLVFMSVEVFILHSANILCGASRRKCDCMGQTAWYCPLPPKKMKYRMLKIQLSADDIDIGISNMYDPFAFCPNLTVSETLISINTFCQNSSLQVFATLFVSNEYANFNNCPQSSGQ